MTKFFRIRMALVVAASSAPPIALLHTIVLLDSLATRRVGKHCDKSDCKNSEEPEELKSR